MSFWGKIFGFEKPHSSSKTRVYREINSDNNINNNAKQRRTNVIADKFNIYGGSRLPENPEELSKNGWNDITHPNKKANHDGATYLNPRTSQKVEFDKGNPKLTGFRGKDHYHWHNPGSIDKKTDYYLDKYGRPCGKGSLQSHILPKGKKGGK